MPYIVLAKLLVDMPRVNLLSEGVVKLTEELIFLEERTIVDFLMQRGHF